MISGIPLIAGDSPRQWREWEMELAPQLLAPEEPSEADQPAADTPPPLTAQELLDEAPRRHCRGPRVALPVEALPGPRRGLTRRPTASAAGLSPPAYAVVTALAAKRDRRAGFSGPPG